MSSKNKSEKICVECGDGAVVHFVYKWSNGLEIVTRALFNPFSKIPTSSIPSRIARSLIPKIFKILSVMSLGKIVNHIQGKDSVRTKTMWEAGEKKGVSICQFEIFGKSINLFMAKYKDEIFVFDGLPRPNRVSKNLSWIDDKAQIKKVFGKAGFPVAKGGSFFSCNKALQTFHKICKPVIVKPAFGSRSRHTTIHIKDELEFKRAFRVAKELSPWVIIEEELQGPVWRVSLIGGKVAGILRRDPPIVYGDGVKTIKELVLMENKNPKRQDIFHEIPFDEFVDRELSYQGLTLSSVPEKGKKVVLHPKVGRSQGGTNTAIINIHPDNTKLFEEIAQLLDDPIVGVDFIISDMKRSWKEQELCGVIECNAIPYLDLHHFPYEGEPVDTMGKLWDVILYSHYENSSDGDS